MRLSTLLALAALGTLARGVAHINAYRRDKAERWTFDDIPGPAGSLTSASDAVDNVELSPDASPDEVLDVGVQHTFPASDPVAVEDAYESAYERERRRAQAARR